MYAPSPLCMYTLVIRVCICPHNSAGKFLKIALLLLVSIASVGASTHKNNWAVLVGALPAHVFIYFCHDFFQFVGKCFIMMPIDRENP